MKTIKTLLAAAALTMLTASCFDDKDPYNAGFIFRKPVYVVNACFANNHVDTISFVSYGNWAARRDAGYDGSWCSFNTMSGHGNTYYTFPVLFQPNTSGQGRGAQFTFSDTDHPGEASATILYWQFATRGDGSLGAAPDVKTIKGSDGSLFQFTYDEYHRPLTLRVTKDEATLHSLTLTYNDADSLLTVIDRGRTLTSKFANDYQPQRLIGSGDTVGYYSQYTSTGFPVPLNTAFNLEHRSFDGSNTYYAYLLGGQSLAPDSLYQADSLRVALTSQGETTVQKYKLTYSNADNRHQSIDANQLVFGTEQCDPYQLLSLYRYCRSSRILSEVTSGSSARLVSATLNTDGSVAQLVLTRKNAAAAGADERLEYIFEY